MMLIEPKQFWAFRKHFHWFFFASLKFWENKKPISKTKLPPFNQKHCDLELLLRKRRQSHQTWYMIIVFQWSVSVWRGERVKSILHKKYRHQMWIFKYILLKTLHWSQNRQAAEKLMFVQVCVAITFHYIGLLPGAGFFVGLFSLYTEAYSTLEPFDWMWIERYHTIKISGFFDGWKKKINKQCQMAKRLEMSSDSGLSHIKRDSHLFEGNKPAWCQFWTL